jgi:phosphoglycerate dehydrogenase-like enzyme
MRYQYGRIALFFVATHSILKIITNKGSNAHSVDHNRKNFMSKRRYAVIGTGAIGGYYGARLQAAGFEVHFLLQKVAARAHAL